MTELKWLARQRSYLIPTETGLVRLRVANLPKFACRVADSSTVCRLLLRESSERLSKTAMMSPVPTQVSSTATDGCRHEQATTLEGPSTSGQLNQRSQHDLCCELQAAWSKVGVM